jgi:hypothetical protein
MKLQKLILMLSSDQDGEVLNAARAIGRELKANGMDWHGLAARLDLSPQEPKVNYDDNSYIKAADIAALSKLFMKKIRLSEREKDFLVGLRMKIDQYGERTFITAKQRQWLHSICEREA